MLPNWLPLRRRSSISARLLDLNEPDVRKGKDPAPFLTATTSTSSDRYPFSSFRRNNWRNELRTHRPATKRPPLLRVLTYLDFQNSQ